MQNQSRRLLGLNTPYTHVHKFATFPVKGYVCTKKMETNIWNRLKIRLYPGGRKEQERQSFQFYYTERHSHANTHHLEVFRVVY